MKIDFSLGPQTSSLSLGDDDTTKANLAISPSGNGAVVGIDGNKDLYVGDLAFGDGSSAPALSDRQKYTTGQNPYVAFFTNSQFVEVHGGDSLSGNKLYNVPGQVSSGSVTMQDSHIVEFTSSGSNIKGEVPTLAVGVADASGTALNWLLRRDANAGQNAIYPVLCSWNGSGLDYVGISDYYVGYAPYHDAAMTEDNYIHVVLCDGSSETTYMNGPTTTTSVRTDASTSLAIPSGQASITVTHVNGVEVIVIVSVANGSPQITFGVYQGAGKVSWQPTVPTGITTPKAATTLSVRNKADSQVGLVVNTSAGFSALLINLSA